MTVFPQTNLEGNKLMIHITGDFHGEINRFNKYFIPDEPSWGKDDYLIICGDFGFIFIDDEEEHALLDQIAQKPYTVLFLDGNHENFNAISRYPVEEWHGGKVHRIRQNILHLMRGQVFEIDGKTFFIMGGGYSRDKCWRVKNETYWDEEMPCSSEYKEAADNLKKHGFKVDYILSHTAPAEMIRRMKYVPESGELELTGFLEWVMYETKYKRWYFGHFHVDHKADEKHRALYYDVVNIDQEEE